MVWRAVLPHRRACYLTTPLTDAELNELHKQYEDATMALRRFQDDKQREAQKRRDEGLREIKQKLEPVFEKLRDEGSYDRILNNVAGVVVMANERADITDLVLNRFDAGKQE